MGAHVVQGSLMGGLVVGGRAVGYEDDGVVAHVAVPSGGFHAHVRGLAGHDQRRDAVRPQDKIHVRVPEAAVTVLGDDVLVCLRRPFVAEDWLEALVPVGAPRAWKAAGDRAELAPRPRWGIRPWAVMRADVDNGDASAARLSQQLAQ